MLNAGSRLGPYEIVRQLGAGGMGEVYLARDTRLERSVAVKILPRHLANDPSFRARFEREARAVSALSHPHICTLHDIGEQEGVLYLVMEHLEGETLASRLKRGPMSAEEALQVAAQLCEALALAHRHGVVHRDLKPGNVMLTRSGVKLLDFGLAKQGPQSAPPISSAVMTEASPLTAQGTIVGTWQYMAPEQLEGMEADARSDIFAFGAMFYEMMTGRRAFEGRSQAGLIAAIMNTQPPVISAVTPQAPPALDRVIRRCLAKDPEDRWQSAADLANELKWIAQGSSPLGIAAPVSGAVTPLPVTATGPQPRAEARLRARRGERLAWMVITVALLGAVAVLATKSFFAPAEHPRLLTASILPPNGVTYDTRYPPALSPNGKIIASVMIGEDGKSSLYLRALDSEEMRKLPDTDGAAHPFWSPDSRWIGFYTADKLKKIDTSGGPAIVLCDAWDGRGGTWSRDGTILFQPRFSDPLFKVGAGGGTPQAVTQLDEKAFHLAHRWPMFLPDGRHFLFYVVATTNPATSENSGIYVGSLDSPDIRKILRVDSKMAFGHGYLLYKSGSTLMAQSFDPEKATLAGDPLPVAAEVSGGVYSWGGADFDVADRLLVYRAGTGGGQTELAWLDRSGNRSGQIGEPDFYTDLRLSWDGLRAVVAVGRDAGDLWLQDLARDVRTRFTFDPADDTAPAFSPDGTKVAFVSARKGVGELFQRDVRGTGEEELLFTAGTQLGVGDWSPDGRFILLTRLSRKTGFDIWTYSVKERKAEPWFEGPLDQFGPRCSPNGRWIAYSSDESGKSEVYVQAFPEKGQGRWQISKGGLQPAWRRDGKEIYYESLDGTLMAADVTTEGTFDVGKPHPLFRARFKSINVANYDVTPDGKRFLVNILKDNDRSGLSATLVQDWTALLKK